MAIDISLQDYKLNLTESEESVNSHKLKSGVTILYLLLVDNAYISPRDLKNLFDKNETSCEVIACSTSKVLVDLFKKLKPDIVIVDYGHFSDDPVDIVKKLHHACPHAYILAFVEHDQYHNLFETLEEGVNDYLVKPLQREDVMLRIKLGLQRAKPVQDTAVLPERQKVSSNIRYFSRAAVVASGGKHRPGLLNRERVFRSNPIPTSLADEEEADQFENLVAQAKLEADNNSYEAIRLFNEAINLYRDKYLTLSPVGSHELFISCVFNLADIFKKSQSYTQIISLCEKALEIDYYDEGVHIRLIEAMLAEGMIARAQAHYDRVTSTFYREMGVKPSVELSKLYEKIGLGSGNMEFDLSKIQDGLKNNGFKKGALLCDSEHFRYSYKLEQLRCERNGQSVLLCMIMITKKDFTKPSDLLLQKVMHNLENVIMYSLRKSDLFARWNDSQFLLLLPGLNREQADDIMDRIEQSFLSQHSLQGLQMQNRIETIFPLEGN